MDRGGNWKRGFKRRGVMGRKFVGRDVIRGLIFSNRVGTL